MSKDDLKLFNMIKQRVENDKIIFNESQESEGVTISPEIEEEILERSFLVYYVEKYKNERDELIGAVYKYANDGTYLMELAESLDND